MIPKLRYASGTPAAALAQWVAGTMEHKFGRVVRGHDVVQIVSVDATNHVCYWKRVGDVAPHNGYPTRYLGSVTPTVGAQAVIQWIDRVPVIIGILA